MRDRPRSHMLSSSTPCVLMALAGVNHGVLGFVSQSIAPTTSVLSTCRACLRTCGTAAAAAGLSHPAAVRHAVKRRRFDSALGCASAATGTSRPLELWLDARGAKADGAVSESALFQDQADTVLRDDNTTGKLRSTSKRSLVVKDDGKLMDEKGTVVGASLEVTDPKSQSRALSLVGSVDWIQVTCSDWTMIPAENLVSAAGGTPTRIAVELSEPSQVQGAAFALQIGVDALLLGPDPDLWEAAVSAREQRGTDGPATGVLPAPADHGEGGAGGGLDVVALSTGRVTRTREGGVGDRVCVDLIQSLNAGEGMLVGSSAKMLALVHAETFETGFVPARPFRINAGPVHSYALLGDGSTKYLSELCAGDQVLVTNWKGESRKVAIGRLKVETRPMIMVEFQGEGGSTGQLFLQQAETVRLISPTQPETTAEKNSNESESEADSSGSGGGWVPLSVTDIEGGEDLLLREISRGTHVGRAIDAVVTET
ncbi:Similar to 3-Dehydroquinate Synthase [Ectocarpus siliculosus]|uniref:Similar to 3-Dehydroquinate Synthase n=1 Tax=Ectocarpus siliculosus TaxID=2880 RepID=D7G089_ECTSI|nr:Similar to 3-Dehydroquinate Synthase [Ectocarpus siliculosus]|eukprot:CBJ32971.1 Similar to 3-Dehydroquinate Synthase [Ectocarpus siliculosus]